MKSSAREFSIIVICALGLSVAFVYWLKTSPGFEAYGGLEVGQPAPAIEASFWVQGTAPDREELKGEVHVLVAWATWCVPCYEEAPALVKAYEKFSDRGVRFFGLTAAPEENRDLILEWLEDREIPWPNGFGQAAVDTLLAYDSQYIPSIWVVGRDGTVTWNRSHRRDETLDQAIERALRKPRPESEPETPSPEISMTEGSDDR